MSPQPDAYPDREPDPATRSGDAAHSLLYRALGRVDRKQRLAARSHEPRRRWPRRVLLAAAIIFLLLAIAAGVTTVSLRRSMQAALPQLDGSIRVAGLAAPVSVTRDAQGVPAIRAASLDDLLFAQGYVTAQDRLWQMDVLRRHAAGELAEVLGPGLIEHDRRQRILQMRAAADRAVAVLPAGQLHQLQAYARGVNAFIQTAEGRPNRLPLEFHLLHYAPAPWSPRDSLLVSLIMSQDLSTEFPQKMNREALSARLPADLLADMYPVGSWRDHPPMQPPVDLTAPTDSIEQIPLDRTQSLATPRDLLHTFNALSPGCEGCVSGSNNWAVAGTRSASGAPLISNDMHLGLSAPDIWYEATLHVTPSAGVTPLDVTGFTLPGIPFVVVGRNRHVAWSFTALVADVQDVRIEHLRGTGGGTEFELPDRTWAPAGHHTEIIRVRAGHDVVLDVLTTTHSIGATSIQTPIISPLYPSERRALSLLWPVYDPSSLTSPLLAVDTAPDAASLVASCGNFFSVPLNLVYADAHSIGYHALARVPIRGPAIERPRAAPQFIMPGRTPDDDDEDESGNNRPTAFRNEESPAWRKIADPKPQAPAQLPGQIPAPNTTNITIGSPISPLPTDALDASQEWSGYIPYANLPSTINPPSGIVATANARITTDDYPYFIADDWIDPYRVERIYRLLGNRTGLTPAEMLHIDTDVHSELDLLLAQRMAYAIDETLAHNPSANLAHDARRLHQAADILRRWNGDLTADSAAAAIVSATRGGLWPMLLSAQLLKQDPKSRPMLESLVSLYTWHEKDTALEELLIHTPQRWLPPGLSNWNELLANAAAIGLKDAHAPADLTGWRYGSLHKVDIAHPVLGSDSIVSRLLGVRTGTGRQPIGGDETTIQATGLHFGPSERFIADLAAPEGTLANLPTGESGDPASPFYLDQFQSWLHGSSYTLPLDRPVAVHTLTLLPQ
jgi:penicillin amidase